MNALSNINIIWQHSGKKIFIDTLNRDCCSNKDNIEFKFSESIMVNGVKDEQADKYIFPKIALKHKEYLYSPVQLRENTEYICEITLPGTKKDVEQQRVTSKNKSWPFNNSKLNSVYTVDNNRYWIEGKDSNDKPITMVIGRMNFKSYVGLVDLSLGEKEQLFIEVITYKLNYYQDFKTLLNSISDQMIDLLLQVGEATGTSFETDYERESEDYIKIIHLRDMFKYDNLQIAIESIIRNPHVQLETEQSKVIFSKAKDIDLMMLSSRAAMLKYIEGGPLAKQFLGYTPREIFQKNKNETYDTRENRYIKKFLEDILWDCQRIYSSVNKRVDNDRGNSIKWKNVLDEITDWIVQLNEWLSESFWTGVNVMDYMPSNSQVLQKRDGYRDVLKFDIKYQLAIKLNWDTNLLVDNIYGDIKPIYELYEIWCFFKLRQVLVNLFGLEKKNDLWCIDNGKLSVNLKKGVASKLKFEREYNNRKVIVILYYNRLFKRTDTSEIGSYSIDFKPDYSLYIKIPDIGTKVFVHFDAKYSFEVSNFTEGDIGTLNAKRANLEKMHTYKDAIKNSIGSYILYPGNNKMNFKESSDIFPGIGTYPLRPYDEINDQNNIQEFIKVILDNLSKNSNV